jgi:hypothetical protein
MKRNRKNKSTSKYFRKVNLETEARKSKIFIDGVRCFNEIH